MLFNYLMLVEVYMGWVNPQNPVKPNQKIKKKWVESGNWVNMSLKTK